jgi:alpha-galactosidase
LKKTFIICLNIEDLTDGGQRNNNRARFFVVKKWGDEVKDKDFEKIYEQYKAQSNMESMNNHNIDDGKEQIVAVRKNDDGDLIAFKTNTGRELDYLTALEEAKAGNLANIDVFHKYGRDIIRSEPDGIKDNNLDQLPEF